MWENPSFSKSISASLERRPARKSQVRFSLKRTEVELQITGRAFGSTHTPIMGRVFLHEVRPKSISLFLKEAISVGQKVAITIDESVRFFAKGVVIGCRPLSMHRTILSENYYGYRVDIMFDRSNPIEARAIQDYCDHLTANYVYSADD